MLFSSSTSITNEMGAVATTAIDGIGVFVILIIGVVLGCRCYPNIVSLVV